MKKSLLTIISICLIAASIFGLYAGAVGLSDVLNVKSYKEEDAAHGLEQIDTLLDGLALLSENEEAYNKGVGDYAAGMITYQNGQAAYAAAGPQLAQADALIAQKKGEFAAAKKTYDDGKKLLEESTAAYNEGKAMIDKLTPLMPMLDQYIAFRDGHLAKLPGFPDAQSWFVEKVRPLAAQLGLEIPADVTDFPVYMQQMYAAGQAKLAEYEAGMAKLEEAKPQLEEAEKLLATANATLSQKHGEYAQAGRDLAAGAAKLADGKKSMDTFEGGMEQIAAGLEGLIAQPEYRDKEGEGEVVCPSMMDICKQELGEDFSFWKLDEDGEILLVNGKQYVDLEVAEGIAHCGQDYIQKYQEAAVKDELLGRMGTYACLILASVAGILAGLFGLLCLGTISTGKVKSAVVFGWISAVLAVAGNIVGLATSYTGYAFAKKIVTDDAAEYVFTGGTQVTALILTAIAAVLFVIIASVVSRAYKASQAKVADDAEEAVAAE